MASNGEQLIESLRRNNVELLESVLGQIDSTDARAALINDTVDGLGNHLLHIGAVNGSYEALDHLLDQEGVEVDPVNRLDGDTPLHIIVRYARDEPEHGEFVADMLVDAGADPRIRNKHGQKPIDLVDRRQHEKMVEILEGAEYALMIGPQEDDGGEGAGAGDGEGDGASDSE